MVSARLPFLSPTNVRLADGKNLKYLLSPAANTPLLAFLFLYHDRDLVQKATSPGLPPHTLIRTLVLWIIWLLTSPRESVRRIALGCELTRLVRRGDGEGGDGRY